MLPAELYGVGLGEGQSVFGRASKIDFADTADLFVPDADGK